MVVAAAVVTAVVAGLARVGLVEMHLFLLQLPIACAERSDCS